MQAAIGHKFGHRFQDVVEVRNSEWEVRINSYLEATVLLPGRLMLQSLLFHTCNTFLPPPLEFHSRSCLNKTRRRRVINVLGNRPVFYALNNLVHNEKGNEEPLPWSDRIAEAIFDFGV